MHAAGGTMPKSREDANVATRAERSLKENECMHGSKAVQV